MNTLTNFLARTCMHNQTTGTFARLANNASNRHGISAPRFQRHVCVCLGFFGAGYFGDAITQWEIGTVFRHIGVYAARLHRTLSIRCAEALGSGRH